MARERRGRPSPVRRPGRVFAAAAAGPVWAFLAAALLGACGEPAGERAVDYTDAVFDPGPDGALRPGLRFVTCGEESHLAQMYTEPLRLTATLNGTAELLLTGCLRGADAEPGAQLALRVTSPAKRPRELTYELGPQWRAERFDLGGWAGETVEVHLERRGPGTTPTAIRDFALRTERPLERPRPAAARALLISLDTFRGDAPGSLGGGARTPALDAFVAAAERFEPHWAAEISTKPSHASLLTGLPAAVHGVDRQTVPLGDDVRTLAERLRDAGVATAGFANQPVLLGAKYGFAQGFDVYRNERWSSGPNLRAAARWLSAAREAPSFAFVHLYAAHSDGRHWPYESDAETPRRIARRFGLADYGCRGGACGSSLLLALNFDARPSRLPNEGELLRALYDAGVEALDRDLGRFFADLRRAGLWDDTLIVVTADHGEAFDEHGYYLHMTAHEEVLRVPLLVKWPGARAGGTTTWWPSTGLDVAPTLLAHFGLGASDLTGADLAQPPPVRRTTMASLHAARLDRWKLLLPTPEHPGGLYDLDADPGERRDLLAAHAAEAERLRALHRGLEELARARSGDLEAGAPVALRPDEIAQLRALGYLP